MKVSRVADLSANRYSTDCFSIVRCYYPRCLDATPTNTHTQNTLSWSFHLYTSILSVWNWIPDSWGLISQGSYYSCLLSLFQDEWRFISGLPVQCQADLARPCLSILVVIRVSTTCLYLSKGGTWRRCLNYTSKKHMLSALWQRSFLYWDFIQNSTKNDMKKNVSACPYIKKGCLCHHTHTHPHRHRRKLL